MTRYLTLIAALGGALLIFTDMGLNSTNASDKGDDGYCPVGTCAIGGGSIAYPVRNCKGFALLP